jgi:hypothetical protein
MKGSENQGSMHYIFQQQLAECISQTVSDQKRGNHCSTMILLLPLSALEKSDPPRRTRSAAAAVGGAAAALALVLLLLVLYVGRTNAQELDAPGECSEGVTGGWDEEEGGRGGGCGS